MSDVSLISLNEYTDMSRPNIQWVVDGLLPRPGLTLLGAEGKKGKSFFALQLALAIGRGEPFLGYRTHKSTVLYLQFDTSELIWRDRLMSLRQTGVDLESQVYMLHPDTCPQSINILTPGGAALLMAATAACNPTVVILDVLRKIHNNDEDSSTEMKPILDQLAEIFTGRSLILVHHTPKLPENMPIQVINCFRGSSAIADDADTLWLLHDTYWYIKPRFGEDRRIRLRRLTNGLWSC